MKETDKCIDVVKCHSRHGHLCILLIFNVKIVNYMVQSKNARPVCSTKKIILYVEMLNS